MILFNRQSLKALPQQCTTPGGLSVDIYTDMTRQPHLLIAGATGSGKSCVVYGILRELLYRPPGDSPGGAELILIDPKRVELSRFRPLPHCLLYASEPPDMLAALRQGLTLIEKRFKHMQRHGMRQYQGSDVYIIIDELADLMTTARRDVMPLLQRIAQIGRAAKVHLICCTQSPIARIIPTEIKCNFDARLGLRTRSAQDSRNIIGIAGLETLPRFGQGYYMTPERSGLYKLPYVTDADIDQLIDHWTAQEKRSIIDLFRH
jgi:S-DNA-T family DNA segregation ATPase FtsK/SpoIIIE